MVMSAILLSSLSVFAERDFRQAGENRNGKDDVEEKARLHRHEMEA
jgi:hypothetical protein